MIKKSFIVYTVVFLTCLGLVPSAQATLVDANSEFLRTLEPYGSPGDSITCLAYFIPDIPNVPSSLAFTQPPQWTDTFYFDYEAAGWSTALADGNKTAYLFGPEITNFDPYLYPLFSFKLFYQWDTNDIVDFPVYLDAVGFDDGTIISTTARRGEPGNYQPPINDYTWEYGDGDPLYQDPTVPEPMTIALLGLGSMLCRKASLAGVRKKRRR